MIKVLVFYLQVSMEVNSTDSKLAVSPATSPAVFAATLLKSQAC